MTSRLHSLVFAGALLFVVPAHGDGPVAHADGPTLQDPARALVAQAMEKMKSGELETAVLLLDLAIRVNPQSTAAHVLRGSLEASRHNWGGAEYEFARAEQTAPGDRQVHFMLADARFSSKGYDGARSCYVTLATDAGSDDLAAYDIYLCDLLAGREKVAGAELNDFKEGRSPAFYFAHGAWNLVHHDASGAKDVMDKATNLFKQDQNGKYAQPLRNAGLLPLPAGT